MKLRVKKTGEILEDVKFIDTTLHKIAIQYLDDGVLRECIVENLLDVEEIKDYEGPKEYWRIDCDGALSHGRDEFNTPFDNACKSLGNYFETKEEAEKAVDKLKAWKRLKDRGFVWQGWDESSMGNGMCVIGCQIPENMWETDVGEDLNLLFGGEE